MNQVYQSFPTDLLSGLLWRLRYLQNSASGQRVAAVAMDHNEAAVDWYSSDRGIYSLSVVDAQVHRSD